jgi:hypothetical protein
VVDKELPSAQGLRWVAAFLGLAVLAVGGVSVDHARPRQNGSGGSVWG